MNAIATPPLEPLRAVVGLLQSHGAVVALGGSGLLASLGHADEVRDWDLTTDAPLDHVEEALRPLAPERFGASGIHADHKLVVEGGAIEVIVGFSIRHAIGVAALPTIVTRTWREVPVGSPEVWAIAYALLGRADKAERLSRWVERAGADPVAVGRLLAQPLPAELAGWLAGLVPSGD